MRYKETVSELVRVIELRIGTSRPIVQIENLKADKQFVARRTDSLAAA